MSRIGLVSCGKQKLDHAAAAKDMYTSTLFRLASTYAADHYDQWFILSAKYGLLAPEVVIEPYEQTLATIPVAARRRWGLHVLDDLPRYSGGQTFFLHAGELYRDSIPFELAALEYKVPLLGLGIGRQLRWYKEHRPSNV